MALNGYKVLPCERKDIESFIEKYHYSHSINGCSTSHCYKLEDPSGVIVGALFYGKMAMHNQWKKYGEKEADVIELRRLVCVDNTPRNAESFLIGRSLKHLNKTTEIKVVVSYADAEYGHNGTVYKASNFEFVGKSVGAKVILWNNKRYHDKSLRTKYKGELKPFAKQLVEAIAKGEATFHKTLGKFIYVYRMRK